METKANYVAVGIFTLIAILAIFGFIYWTARIGDTGETALLRVRIPGSASGLSRGSAVLFNGVKVGDVRRVYIDVNNPAAAIADTQVDRLTPITRSTTADIGIAGLTGQANIELKGTKSQNQEPSLFDVAEANGEIATITANPSAVANLLETAQDIFTRADKVLTGLEGFVSDTRGPLTETVKNAQTFSEALSSNAEGVGKVLENIGKLSTTIGRASDTLEGTLTSAREILDAVDRDKVKSTIANVESFTRRLDTASENIDGLVNGVKSAAGSIDKLAKDADQTISRVNEIVAAVDPDNVRTTITSIGKASEKLQGTLTSANEILDAVDSEKVKSTIANVESLTNRINVASENIDEVVDGVKSAASSIDQLAKGAGETVSKVNGIVAAVDPNSVKTAMTNIAQASATARNVANDVDKVTSKFATHSDDIDEIVSDAKELTNRLNQASVRVDGILVKVDKLLGSDEANGLVADARATLKSFRQVAETLNGKLGPILANFSRFSDQGLGEVRGLVRDTRRSIDRIEEAVTDFERNPQRIITGGSGTVREYDGRARR